ncbi:hypothetical protein BV898_06872 [Hypsibius exemplaris]|uniref:WAP domain-containing protein n=1 Tax=Hypsibius exemplaris TaxID=2072580 RepID=A0A1W0WUZ1_HYPEX|nr:hypothetical protein BV898_06872 [Hypsibius exemplaris]
MLGAAGVFRRKVSPNVRAQLLRSNSVAEMSEVRSSNRQKRTQQTYRSFSDSFSRGMALIKAVFFSFCLLLLIGNVFSAGHARDRPVRNRDQDLCEHHRVNGPLKVCEPNAKSVCDRDRDCANTEFCCYDGCRRICRVQTF